MSGITMSVIQKSKTKIHLGQSSIFVMIMLADLTHWKEALTRNRKQKKSFINLFSILIPLLHYIIKNPFCCEYMYLYKTTEF